MLPGRGGGQGSQVRLGPSVAWVCWQKGDVRLYLIGVSVNRQDQGIGSKLVDVFLDTARKKGAKSAQAVVTRGDERLERFLERRGFATGEIMNISRRLDY